MEEIKAENQSLLERRFNKVSMIALACGNVRRLFNYRPPFGGHMMD